MSVRLGLLAFLPFTQKIFRQPIPENFRSFVADAHMKKIQKFSFTPSQRIL